MLRNTVVRDRDVDELRRTDIHLKHKIGNAVAVTSSAKKKYIDEVIHACIRNHITIT